MAKNGTWIRILLIIGIALLGFAASYGMFKGNISKNTGDIKDLKAEGCIPAREAKTNIEVIRKDIEIIKSGQERQEGKIDRILERLP